MSETIEDQFEIPAGTPIERVREIVAGKIDDAVSVLELKQKEDTGWVLIRETKPF